CEAICECRKARKQGSEIPLAGSYGETSIRRDVPGALWPSHRRQAFVKRFDRFELVRENQATGPIDQSELFLRFAPHGRDIRTECVRLIESGIDDHSSLPVDETPLHPVQGGHVALYVALATHPNRGE